MEMERPLAEVAHGAHSSWQSRLSTGSSRSLRFSTTPQKHIACLHHRKLSLPHRSRANYLQRIAPEDRRCGPIHLGAGAHSSNESTVV